MQQEKKRKQIKQVTAKSIYTGSLTHIYTYKHKHGELKIKQKQSHLKSSIAKKRKTKIKHNDHGGYDYKCCGVGSRRVNKQLCKQRPKRMAINVI